MPNDPLRRQTPFSTILDDMEPRETPVPAATPRADVATDADRAEVRAEFRRKLSEARERMSPEKWAELRRTFGRDVAA